MNNLEIPSSARNLLFFWIFPLLQILFIMLTIQYLHTLISFVIMASTFISEEVFNGELMFKFLSEGALEKPQPNKRNFQIRM